MKKVTIPYRAVHLDFHTSEHCPEVGAEFSEAQFIGALQKGHVNSINLFGMCHHGWCYYPTRVGLAHPNLKTDLLGRMLQACTEAGIGTTVYITVAWNDRASREHPEWVVRRPDGTMDGPPHRHPQAPRPWGWYRLCLNTPYLDEMVLPVAREVQALYNPAGLWFDITGQHECSCDWCTRGMIEAGLDVNSPIDRRQYAETVQKNYLKKTTELVWTHNPEATIYHNDSERKGRRDLYPFWTHYEIESLPTGGWGYDHFPSNARYFTMLPDTSVVSMTGKFHRVWGEFGGFKNPLALRYEVAQSIALGCRCSIGDHLHPSGRMDEETYRIIGEAYRDVEEREEWLLDATPVADVAVLAPSAVRKDPFLEPSEVGAGMMLMETQTPHVLLDEEMDISPYQVLILPDAVRVDGPLEKKLKKFVASGGKLILSAESGLDPGGTRFVLDVGAEYTGPSTADVEYCAVSDAICTGMVRSPVLLYRSGVTTKVTSAEVLAETWLPFFNRTYEHFCGHLNTPCGTKAEWPCVIRNGNIIHIAQPLFSIYRDQAMQLHRDLLTNCLNLLYTDTLLEADLPSCGRATVMRQGARNRTVVHLTYVNPVHRGPTEVVEDIVPLFEREVALRLEREPKRVYLAPSREELPFTYVDGRVRFSVPRLELSQIVVAEHG
jgi:hypothetical protein